MKKHTGHCLFRFSGQDHWHEPLDDYGVIATVERLAGLHTKPRCIEILCLHSRELRTFNTIPAKVTEAGTS